MVLFGTNFPQWAFLYSLDGLDRQALPNRELDFAPELLSPMKVLLTYPPVAEEQPWEGAECVRGVTERFARSPDQRGHRLVDSAEEADLILYLEPQVFRDRPYAELLLKEENLRRFPEKCFAFGYADFFIGFLPGLYVCLPQEHAADRRYGSWSYLLGLPNPLVEPLAERGTLRSPSLLFSFRGGPSAPVRDLIFRSASQWSAEARITELGNGLFHNIPEKQQRLYAEEMLDSQFVLCPRGLGCSSHRLFETMALGRVPVILSDAWVEPVGPAWSECSVRVAESDVARLPHILRSHQERSTEMGRRARIEWQTWFAPEVAVPRFFDRLAELAAAQPTGMLDYPRLWRSWKFYAPYNLAPHQKLWRNLRSGELVRKFRRARLVG